MKILLLAGLLLQSVLTVGQGQSQYSDFNIPTKDGQAFYELVDSFQASKAAIYNAVRKTFSDLFKDANSVIELEDKETGQIIAKGHNTFNHKIQLGIKETTTIRMTINIQAKDNKFRIQIYDFYTRGSTESSFTNLDRIRKLAKGWRERFFPVFHTETTTLLSLFSTTIIQNLKAADF